MLLLWIVAASLLGTLAAILLAGLFLVFPDKTRRVLLPILISYATGTLLGAAFLGLLPRAVTELPASVALSTVLAGIVLFFVLEKLVVWRHAHGEEHGARGTAGTLILVGDAFHNFVDGAILAGAFLTSIPLGITTAVAVFSHEIPQEVGDFAILLDSGYSRAQAFLLNGVSGLSALLGALLAYAFFTQVGAAVPYALALAAAGFVYVAVADLFPGLHREAELRRGVRQVGFLLAGIATIAWLR